MSNEAFPSFWSFQSLFHNLNWFLTYVPVCRSAAVPSLITKYAWILGRTPVCELWHIRIKNTWNIHVASTPSPKKGKNKQKKNPTMYLLLCIFRYSWPSWHSREQRQLHMCFEVIWLVCLLPQVWVLQGCFGTSHTASYWSETATLIHLTWWSHLLLKLDIKPDMTAFTHMPWVADEISFHGNLLM